MSRYFRDALEAGRAAREAKAKAEEQEPEPQGEPEENDDVKLWRSEAVTRAYAIQLRERLEFLENSLMSAALFSTDAQVCALAHKIDAVDKMLEFLER